jgi:hypothetical protein
MRRITFPLAIVFSLIFSAAALAQETFEGDDYSLELPNAVWKSTPRSGNALQSTEFIYGDRLDGYLRLRKEVVEADVTPAKLASRDEDLKLRYLNGFVGGKTAPFSGRLNGIVLSYEFTSAGKPMAGRIYYLQADSRTIYVLQFTGLRDKLLRIQNQTDSIARSFRLKQ